MYKIINSTLFQLTAVVSCQPCTQSLLGGHLYVAIVTLERVSMLATAGESRASSVQRAILWTNLGYVSTL